MSRKMFLALAAATLILVACGPAGAEPTVASVSGAPGATQAPAGIDITDGLGRRVTLAAPAQRIVSMAPSNTEILFAVDAGKQVVGRDEFSDYPAEAKSLPSIGGSMGQYSLEQIVALKPDLVLAGGINTPEQVKSIEDLKLKVFYLGNPTTLEEMYANLGIVARLTGHESESVTLIDSLKVRVRAVGEKIASSSAAPMVYYEIDATDPNKPYTAGKGTFIDLLITRAGGVNFGSKFETPYPQVSLEDLIVSNPAIILLGDSLYGTTAETLKQRPGWDALDAVKNDNIFPFDDNLVSRPGPRLVDGLEALAKIMHPELFK
jgi:iron complex transport system substrate-binding protein